MRKQYLNSSLKKIYKIILMKNMVILNLKFGEIDVSYHLQDYLDQELK